jgi:hypothetical protein
MDETDAEATEDAAEEDEKVGTKKRRAPAMVK